MTPFRVTLTALALTLPAAAAAQEDAAVSEFATDLHVTIEGTVASFDWAAPHCKMTVMVTLPDGRDIAWNLRLAPPDELKVQGWRPNSLKPGQRVELEVNPSLDGTTSGLVLAARRSNGKPIGKTADI
jgi:hypothetical protein